ncbi:MAG: BamA/TamA family outer membrane protein [Rudanella sp.]|nr:BamA/TamA family outer membrane protein [Rudanella sp.]
MKPYYYFILLALFQSCNIARRLPPNERLYVGTDINLSADSTISKDDKKNLEGQLKDLARPRPNKTLFGIPYKVGFYYLLGEPKKEKGLRAWFRRKFGEAPVLASAKAISSNATIFAGLMENEGYFRSSVSGKLVEDGYKARGVYDARVPARYTIDSVLFLVDSTPARRAMFNISPQTLLKVGDPYRFATIQAEQQRISTTLKNRGFYYFQPDYVAFLADSVVGKHKVRLYLAIKPDMPVAAGLPYYIRNLYVYPNYNLASVSVNDTNRSLAYVAKGDTSLRRVFIVDSARLYKPQLFNDILSLKPGRRYSSRAQDLTLSRFINVGTFKFVRNRFAPIQQGDSSFLDVHYYLTPYPKKSIRAEIAGTSRSNSLVGSELTLSILNRNFFKRAEQLSLNLTGGIEVPIAALGLVTRTYRYGATLNLTAPRLIVPFRIRYDQRQSLPKTLITLGYEAINRYKYYTLNSFNGSYGYAFRTNQRVEQTFTPFSINYLRVGNLGPFSDSLAINPETAGFYNQLLFSEQIIMSSLYTISYSSSPRTNSPNTYRVQFGAETAGNLASLLIRPTDGYEVGRIFEVPYAQYLKLDLDTRYYSHITPGISWANRFLAGIGLPYGNINIMPLVKQYFSGGSNSLRGFRPRTVGPGQITREFDGQGFVFQDGGGDIKLEANTELRPKINQYLQGALFIDVGNVWLKDKANATLYGELDSLGRPLSNIIFSRNFLKELAVSGGIGLRIDLSYFLFRLDLGIPLRKPDRPEGQRWVLDEINLRSRDWRRQNLILNVAVGYPF